MNGDWIFCRGLARETGHWREFLTYFSSCFPGARVFPLDIPGTGQHFEARSPWSVDSMMEWVRGEYLARREGNRPVFLLANSLGAMLALSWAREYPTELSRAILINPSAAGVSPLSARLLPEGLEVGRRLLGARTPRVWEQAILDWVSNDETARARALDAWEGIRQARPVSSANLFRQLVAGARFRLSPEPIQAPVLILSGAGDRVVSSRCSTDLQRHLGCQLEVHPTGGHDLALDAPEWVLDKIQNWVAGAAVPSSKQP